MSSKTKITSSEFLTIQTAALKQSKAIQKLQAKVRKVDEDLAKLRAKKLAKLEQQIQELQKVRSQNIQRMASSDFI